MDARSPLDARFPECIEHAVRLATLEELRRDQNGSLKKMADAIHAQGERFARMEEKLDAIIVRQADDREAVEKLRAIHDSRPLPEDVVAAKPPEQQLDAAARVLGLPLWKALLYALLLGGALAGGGKGTGALIEHLFQTQHAVQTTGR